MMFVFVRWLPPLLSLSATAAAALSIPTGSTRTTKLSSSSVHVKVWDNVLVGAPQQDEGCPPTGSSSARQQQHLLRVQEYAAKSGLGHRCFTRPFSNINDVSSNSSSNKYNGNVIERTIDAILTEMESAGSPVPESKHQYVEYWTRQEWRHIEAHADVDENLSKRIDQHIMHGDDDNFVQRELQSTYPGTYRKGHGHRYPIFGHVLYLQVGTNVKGPTCIFPGRSSGGDLLHSIGDDEGDDDNDDIKENREKEVPLCIVPAVAGRLLRFDGRDLHAVPRPTDIWMLPFVQGAAEYEPDEIWGRSVILFNVWPGSEQPPLDVPLDLTDEEEQQENRTVDTASSLCNSYSNWREIAITQKGSTSSMISSVLDSGSNQSVKVWLLGNERRREHPLRTVSLVAPAIIGGHDAMREALNEERQVTELLLRRQ